MNRMESELVMAMHSLRSNATPLLTRRSSILSLLAIGCICLPAAAAPGIASGNGGFELKQFGIGHAHHPEILVCQPGGHSSRYFTNTGTLPAGLVNIGIVLDRCKVKVDSFEK